MHHADARSLLEGLETGALAEAEFEPRLAALLEVRSERLIDRLFGGMQIDAAMLDGVRAAHRAGVPCALLSNSWGSVDRYELPDDLFDARVLSGQVGLRKPDPAIYALAAERLSLAPEACVFVDDLPGNLEPARALGMATILHRGDAAATLAEAGGLLGYDLRPRPRP